MPSDGGNRLTPRRGHPGFGGGAHIQLSWYWDARPDSQRSRGWWRSGPDRWERFYSIFHQQIQHDRPDLSADFLPGGLYGNANQNGNLVVSGWSATVQVLLLTDTISRRQAVQLVGRHPRPRTMGELLKAIAELQTLTK